MEFLFGLFGIEVASGRRNDFSFLGGHWFRLLFYYFWLFDDYGLLMRLLDGLVDGGWLFDVGLFLHGGW